jgi:hypothetical protein
LVVSPLEVHAAQYDLIHTADGFASFAQSPSWAKKHHCL